jgi:hypothetical protein
MLHAVDATSLWDKAILLPPGPPRPSPWRRGSHVRRTVRGLMGRRAFVTVRTRSTPCIGVQWNGELKFFGDFTATRLDSPGLAWTGLDEEVWAHERHCTPLHTPKTIARTNDKERERPVRAAADAPGRTPTACPFFPGKRSWEELGKLACMVGEKNLPSLGRIWLDVIGFPDIEEERPRRPCTPQTGHLRHA